MKTLKESLVKLFFVLPMLAILIASTGIVSYSVNSKKEVKSSAYYSVEKQKSNNAVTITTSEDNNALLLKETEHTEFDFEINWNSSFSFTQHFLEVTQKTFCFSNFKKVFAANKFVSLYDLFCNWKLHIS